MAEKNGGGDPAEEEEDKNDDGSGEEKKKKHSDPELLMCLLQPCPAGSDPEYIGIRRLLLSRKSQPSINRRRVSFCILIQRFNMNQSIIHFQCESVCLFVCELKDWRCNGKGYVAFRNYIRRPRNWERDSLRTPSLQTTPGNR